MTGGEAMISAAMANGINTIFGIPGAQIYPLFDAMQRLGVRTITTRHEQGAAYMAYGYARALGRPSAFAVVPGPGVLNTTAALCTAMGTNTPLLCLTGQVPSSFLHSGRGHLHELADQPGTLKSLIKDALHISDAVQTPAAINQAFQTMLSGRPGPVAVEMCWDTMAASHPVVPAAIMPPLQPALNEDEINAAADAISRARAPLIMCGGGAQHASEEVQALAELLQAPVTAFRSGRGVVSEDHPLGVSSVAARHLYEQADLIIGIGSRLEMIYMRWRNMMQYEQQPPADKPLIRIDIDPAEMDRLRPHIGVLADSAAACRRLVDVLATRLNKPPSRSDEIARVKTAARRAVEKVQPQLAYLDVIRDVVPRDGFIVPELSQMGFASYYGLPVYQPRTYVTEGFQGTLGFGFQTGLGVKVAAPEQAVVCVSGDGGFMFGVQELSTAAAHGIGLITLVFNNRAFANVRRDQMNNYAGRLNGADLHNPDFVALAESFGVAGARVSTPQELQPVLARAIADDKPMVIEVDTPLDSETSPWEFIAMPQAPDLTDAG